MNGYARPQSLDELWQLLAQPGARILAGGTDLIPRLRLGLLDRPLLVSLADLPELRGIELGDEEIRIGAATTLAELSEHTLLAACLPALVESAAAVGAPQHRSSATLGGNLCLDTRCTWFNQSEFWRQSLGHCLKYGGDTCHVATRSDRCYAVLSCDTAPALAVLNARLVLGSARGSRELAVAEFYRSDGRSHLALLEGEMLLEIRIPKPLSGSQSLYLKARARETVDFPLLGLAVSARLHQQRLLQLNWALSACESSLITLDALAEGLVDGALPLADCQAMLKALQKRARPMDNAFYGPNWRKQMVSRLARQALQRLGLLGGAL